MLTIYSVPVSLYCAKLRILLRHKTLQWEEKPPPGGYGSNEYKAMIPSGNLPALRDGQLLIADSEAIAEYLNEKYPSPAMLPDELPARAKVRELSRFHDTRLEPELRRLFPVLPSAKRQADVVAIQISAINIRLQQLSVMLKDAPDFETHALRLADCGYPITFAWIDAIATALQTAIQWPPEVIRYRQWIEGQPAIKVELAEYQPKLNSYLQNLSID